MPLKGKTTQTARSNRRKPELPEALSAELHRLHDLLNDADDMSAIIVGVAYVDACLASLLAKRLRVGSTTEGLLQANGPLGSFAVRSRLAYALALINQELCTDLCTLGEIRNIVAHHHFAHDFNSPEIGALCEKLQYIASLKSAVTAMPIYDQHMLAHTRNRFVLTTSSIVNRLLLIGLGTKHAGAD